MSIAARMRKQAVLGHAALIFGVLLWVGGLSLQFFDADIVGWILVGIGLPVYLYGCSLLLKRLWNFSRIKDTQRLAHSLTAVYQSILPATICMLVVAYWIVGGIKLVENYLDLYLALGSFFLIFSAVFVWLALNMAAIRVRYSDHKIYYCTRFQVASRPFSSIKRFTLIAPIQYQIEFRDGKKLKMLAPIDFTDLKRFVYGPPSAAVQHFMNQLRMRSR